MTFKKVGLVALTVSAAALFVLGTTGASDAKGKKKSPEMSPVCMTDGPAVCGSRGGQRFTYANSCYAGNDGAMVVGKGVCKKGGGMKKAAAKKPAAKAAAKPAAKKEDKKK